MGGTFITILMATLLLFLAPVAPAQPSVEAVVNGASFEPLVSAGSVVSIFGTNLAASTTDATAVPLPTSLNGVSVTIGGIEAPLYFVSSNQINAQIPFEVTGEQTTVVVATPQGQSPPFSLHLVPAAPGIFTLSRDGEGNPILVDPAFRLVDTVRPGERVILYATGLGPTDPPAATGDGGALAEPFNRVIDLPEVFIGGQPATVEFAGLAPGFVAAYQLNVVAPEILATSTLSVVSGGRPGNVTTISASIPGPVQASPTIISEMRPVDEFRRVQLLGIATIEVQIGEGGPLRIEGSDNVLPLVTTEVRNGALQIGMTRGFFSLGGVDSPTVTVGAEALDRIELLGVGSISATDVSAENFEVRIAGVGTVEASGDTNSLDVLVQGVGNASLFALAAHRARVQVIGAGNAEVNAAESLFARVDGVGNIFYTGNPQELDTQINGFGTIEPR